MKIAVWFIYVISVMYFYGAAELIIDDSKYAVANF